MNRLSYFLILAIFLMSVGLRLSLTLVNREANDDHMEVVDRILQTHTLPQKDDCWECFQPKFYHASVALTLQGLGMDGASQDTQILVGELVNFLAGVLTVGVLGIFIQGLTVKAGWIKPLGYALAALNPQLIGISSQATNDAFAILFSTLALYSTYRFFRKPRLVTFLLIVFFLSLGIASKTNVWVTAAAIGLALLVRAWLLKGRRLGALAVALIFLIAVLALAVLNPLNQYISNTRVYGAPILLNIPKPPLPQLTEITYPRRPGIISVKDGFLTFKFFSLLRNPLNRDIGNNIPTHRTSLWTQLYASANSAHFENFPPSWATTGEEGFWISRGIFVLALLPTLIFLLGVGFETYWVMKNFIRRDEAVSRETNYGLDIFVLAGYVLFIALYALIYRDFAVMKAVFIFPGLIAFSLLFLRACERIDRFLSRRARWIIYPLLAVLGALLVFYLLDTVTLIQHLYLLRIAA